MNRELIISSVVALAFYAHETGLSFDEGLVAFRLAARAMAYFKAHPEEKSRESFVAICSRWMEEEIAMAGDVVGKPQ